MHIRVKRIFYYVRRWGQASHEGRWDLMGWFHWLNNHSRPTRFFKETSYLTSVIEFLVGFFPSWFVTVNKNKKRSMKPNWKLIKRRRPIILPKTLEWNRASYIRPSARLPTTFFICIPPYSSLMLFIPRSSLHLRWLLVRQDWAILCVLGSTGRGHPLKNFHHHLSTQQKRVLVIFEKMLRKNE
jgi:hypothetical protein